MCKIVLSTCLVLSYAPVTNICLLFLKCIIDKYLFSVFLIFINEKYLSRDCFCKKNKNCSMIFFV